MGMSRMAVWSQAKRRTAAAAMHNIPRATVGCLVIDGRFRRESMAFCQVPHIDDIAVGVVFGFPVDIEAGGHPIPSNVIRRGPTNYWSSQGNR